MTKSDIERIDQETSYSTLSRFTPGPKPLQNFSVEETVEYLGIGRETDVVLDLFKSTQSGVSSKALKRAVRRIGLLKHSR